MSAMSPGGHDVAREVLAGVWRFVLPYPVNIMKTSNCYCLETTDGLVLIDSGWTGSEVFEAIESGLRHIGGSVTDVRGVLLTHSHLDHSGQAARIRSISGAWVALHRADQRLLDIRSRAPRARQVRFDRLMIAMGVPAHEIAAMRRAMPPGSRDSGFVNRDIEDLRELPEVDLDIVAVRTPGHTPGHCCYWLPDQRVFFSGDHVLGSHVPAIPWTAGADEYSAQAMFESLNLVPQGTRLLLPGHGEPVSEASTRVEEVRSVYLRRLAAVREVVRAPSEPTSAWQVAASCGAPYRPWHSLSVPGRYARLREVQALLEELARLGVVTREESRASRLFRAVPGGPGLPR